MSSTEQGQSPAASNGEVSAEDAESLAAQFRPAWELEDAPFAAGGAVSAEAVDALSTSGNAGAAVAAQAAASPASFTAPVVPPAPRAPTFDQAPQAPPPAANGGGMHAKTMMGMAAPQIPQMAPAPPAAVAAPAAFAVQHAVQEEERPLIRSERPPAIGVGVSASRGPARPAVVRPIVDAQNAGNSDQYAIPRKSNLPMVIGVGAVLIALAGVGIAVKFATDGPPKTNTAEAQATRPKNDIPPPPEATAPANQGPLSQDIPVMKPGSLPKAGDPADPGGGQVAAQPVAQPAAAQPAAAQPKPQPIAAAPVAAPPPRGGGAVAAQPPQPPQPPQATGKPAKPPKGGNGGIVRDSPF